MAKFWFFLSVLLWISYLLVTPILLFTRGFLLTRDVQSYVSSCTFYKNRNWNEDWRVLVDVKASNKQQVCLKPQAKVVLLIVDALRFDFLLYDETKEFPLPYENRMPVISTLLHNFPNNTRMYKFVADPPTTTMQRLKALTTGSLPTFIDAGSNFATQEIVEDNIIDQVVLNDYHAVFTGDDTWTSLYPNRFLRNYPYPSFDVWDLDTVDDGVKKHIFPELQNDDWHLLVGHFLGVDHCGHRYGPNHLEMKRKLGEINDIISKVVAVLPEDTIMFVVGDHGMTITGDHGGDSPEETTAGMFVYSKKTLRSLGESPTSVKQVDLIPTLSTILGIPIPFQNLGTVILDCLPETSDSVPDSSWQKKLFFLSGNVKQVVQYLNATSKSSNIISDTDLNIYLDRYFALSSRVLDINNEEQFLNFENDVRMFLKDIREEYEEAWVQFDTSLMSRGLLFLFLTIFFVFIITDGLPLRSLAIICDKYLSSHMIYLVAIFAPICLLLYSFLPSIGVGVFMTCTIFTQLVFVFLIIQNWDIISLNWHSKNQNDKIISLIYKILVLFNLFVSFSNSFINEESVIQLFCLITIFLLGLVNASSCFSTEQSIKKRLHIKLYLFSLIFLIFVRASMYFWRCRVEQEWCFASGNGSELAWFKLEASKLQWAVSGLFLTFFVIITKQWLTYLGNLNGFLSTVLLMKFIPTVIVVCIAGYWVLEKLPGQQTNLKTVNYLALCVYGLTIGCIFNLFMKPLCVYMLPKGTDLTVPLEENIIPHIYNSIKEYLYRTKKSEATENIPVVYGLGTVYSAAFMMLGIYLVLLFNLLLGISTGPSAIIMFAAVCFILGITSIWRIGYAKSVEDLLEVPNFCILSWIIICQYFFYATGHQPTFPNINWEAAFIGTSGLIRNNFILGTLIIINTFCSHILMGVLLPLLLIFPFTVFVVLPAVVKRKDEFKDVRGELTLFEKVNLTDASMFTLTFKYLAGHAIRVFASMLAATIHCRHLMVWNIFAPKLIFEVIGLFVTLASVFFGYCFFYRISVHVERLVVKLNKSS